MIIDGRAIAEKLEKEIQEEVSKLAGRSPCLAVVLVGEHPPSKIYVNRKIKACGRTGISSIKKLFPDTVTESRLLEEIRLLNENPEVDGILVQMPLPQHIQPSKVIDAISPEKDVDGFHPLNVGKLLIGDTSGFYPCTPYGIQLLLKHTGVDTAGMNALIIGRSTIVGKPLAALLMQNAPFANATVTVAHRFSKNVKELSNRADLIVVAIGIPRYLTSDMIKEGAIVIDVGINQVEDSASAKGYRIVGDVDFENVKDKCSYITPVPGGVGPMTIVTLLNNTLKSYQRYRVNT